MTDSDASDASIGTLNEGPLHQALKAIYTDARAEQEVKLDGFVADVVGADDVIYEIQTGGFSSLKRKLGALVQSHRVVLVHPIPEVRYIVKLVDDPDQPASRRRSPKRGTLAGVAAELVSIPNLLNHPNFELEVVLTEEDEYRVLEPGRNRRRKGWRVVQRRLVRVLAQERFSSAEDLFRLVPDDLPEEFTTEHLAVAMGEPRWLAQKLAYCLREAGEIDICRKTGNALVYRCASKTERHTHVRR